MNKQTYCILFIILACVAIEAQDIHEPNSDIYKDIDRWAVQGYITEALPLIRPYPVLLIERMLNQVIDNGSTEAQIKAAGYKEILHSRPIHPGFTTSIEGKNDEMVFTGAPFANGILRFDGILTASYNLAMYGITSDNGAEFNVPGTYTPYPDFISDVANIGPLEIRQEWTSITTIGTEDLYFQAGLSRASFGPFYDNGTIVGPQSPRAGHFSLNFRRPRFSFEMLFQTLAASDDYGQGIFPEKFLIIHSFNFRPIDKLELGFTESVIWGGRMEPLYLVPFTYLFASQSMTGFSDNSFIGLHLRWYPFKSLVTNAQVYIDDFPFNRIFEGNQKYKLSSELGMSWAPEKTLLKKLDIDYTVVFPYMYTHWNIPDENRYNDEPNFWNYTHLGKKHGADLEPNSDRISVRSSWKTFSNLLNLNWSAYFMRHGNASEGKAGLKPEYHDGSIFDDGATDPEISGDNSSQKNPYEYFNFLTQIVLDIRLGSTIELSWVLPVSFGTFKITGEYCIEYGWNRELESNNNGFIHYWSIGAGWSW
jgi:hypothetical protein